MIVCRQMDIKQIIPNIIMDPEKRDSGACDLNDTDHDNIYLKDAFTNTPLCGDVFVLKPGTNNNGYACDRDITNNSQGERVITMATQTPEVEIHEPDGVLQDPCHTNGILMLPPHPPLSSIYHGTWPIAKDFPTSQSDGSLDSLVNHDTASIFSFNSSNTNASAPPVSCTQATQPQLGTKVEMVYSLLSMLGTHDKDDMSRTLLAMSSSQDSCVSMRQSGCLPLLIQLLHGSDKDSSLLGNTRGSKAARARASAALHNIVHSHPDDKRGRREARVLRLLEQIRAHCDQLRDSSSDEDDEEKKSRSVSRSTDIDHHPGPAIAALMKLSFDEEHRHAICTLGGLQAIGELLQVDHEVHANTTEQYNITMRRYACMALTNLTFGDGTNKALLCSMRGVMDALIAQLHSTNEDLCQVAASVLRNLSWRADLASKKMLREVGAVTTLMRAAMRVQKESTLKSILSALWNLSAHCSENKADICTVEGAVEFLVSTLTYKSPSKTLAIIENGGGVLRNVSSHIAVREDYRKVLRQHGCLHILLKHLRSPSLTIVSNACGTLWNLSARCPEDQHALWEMGAVCMLRNLVHSKHRMISMGSAAALKNLLAAKPATMNIDSDKHMKSNMPTLHARKQRAIEAEIDQNLSETCENMESPRNSPTETRKPDGENSRYIYSSDGFLLSDMDGRRSLMRAHMFMRTGSGDGAMLFDNRMRSPHRVTRSGSQDSVGSVHSDISHDRARVQHMLAKSSKLLYERQGGVVEKRRDSSLTRFNSENNGNTIENLRHPQQHMLESEEDSRDETINYSSKYIDHGIQNCMDSAKPNPCQNVKMTNYNSGPTNYSSQQHKYMYMVPSQYQPMGYPERQIYDERMVNSVNSKNNSEPLIPTYGVYAETDLDNIDQPTDYGKRYAECTDGPCADRSMNYASTYNDPDPNCADCRLEEARRTNERVEQTVHTVHDDSLKTFCTEGTPLNYLSTATSLTDLSGKHEKGDLKKDLLESCAEDETKNYTLEYSKETSKALKKSASKNAHADDDAINKNNNNNNNNSNNNNNNNSAKNIDKKAKRACHSVAPSAIPTFRSAPIQCMKDFVSSKPSNEGNPIQVEILDDPCEGPPDQVKTYCEEGTPVSFSRVSSISSLHSSDANDHDLPQPRPNVLQSIKENESSSEENSKIGIVENIVPGINDIEAGSILPGVELEDDSKKTSNGMVVLPETGSPSDREHKTVTFDDNHMVEETPLMFSRCSSLGSLSSFEAHSVHSSVVSEYSRRASEVVSPSELPDSPSETFPPSPTRKRAAKSSTVGEQDDIEEHTDEMKDFTVEAPEGAKIVPPVEGVSTEKIMIVDPLKVEMISDIGKIDSPLVYNMEGTPPNFSETTSLSALSFSDEDSLAIGKKSHRKQTIGEAKLDKLSEKDDKENSSMSEVSEGEEDILAQCISSAMPSNSSKKIRRSTSDNALKKKSDSWKNENLVNPRSKFLGKASLCLDKTNLGSLRLKSCLQSASSLPKDDEELLNSDAVKSYATEGTPLNFSRTTSLSDLSILIHENASPKNLGIKDAEESDNSSVCDENDKLLSEIIQSAKPKGKVCRKAINSMDQTAEVSSNSQEKIPFQIPSFKEKKYTGASIDSVKTYAVEGTPINFSNATSLSDLTIDSIGSSEAGLVLKDNSTKLKTEQQNDTIANGESSIFPLNCLTDSPKHYMMEGTPITFSRNDSLSSLSCDDADDMSLGHQAPGSKLGKTGSTPQSLNSRWKLSPKKGSKLADNKSEFNRQVVGQSQEEEEVKAGMMDPEGYLSDEVPKVFAVEDNLLPFGRNSSSGRLKSKPHNEEHSSPNKMSGTKGSSCQEAGIHDQKFSFKVEGTPLCFSRNSSLSSLSIESVSNDFSVTEEALLEACISSAMPKGGGGDKTKLTTDKSSSKLTPSKLPKFNSTAGMTPTSDSTDNEKKSSMFPRNESSMSRSSEDYNLKQHTQTSPPPPSSLGPHSPSGRQTLDIIGIANQYSNVDNLQNDALHKSAKSCSDFSTNPVVEARQRFGWCRSKSQDSDGFLKHKKDYSNHEIANGSSSLSNSPFLDLMETAIQNNTMSSKDNRLVEEKQKSTQVFSRLPHSSDADSNGSIEKVDSEKSEAAADEDEDDSQYVRQKSLVTKDDSMNIMIPEAIISDALMISDDLNAIVKLQEEEEKKIRMKTDEDRSSFEHEISPEEERALEENASLVVCELITKREFSSSTFDEDSLIENESISLVSNDYTSDTASEVSITWSKNSEDLSEYSGSTISQSDTSSRRARIIKPTVNQIEPQVKQEPEGPKSVRGRRKPLYSRKNTNAPAKTTPAKSESPKAVRPLPNGRQQSGTNKTNANSPKKTSAKNSPSTDIPVNKVNPRTSNVRRSSGNGSRSMSPGGPLRSLNNNNNKQSVGSKLPVVNSDQPSHDASTGHSSQVERPKPPIKQGTFTKETPTANGTSDKDKEDQTNQVDANPPVVKMREKKTSSSSPRSSGGSTGGSQRNSDTTPPESWTKALGSFNFIVDTSHEQGYHAPFEQIQMQRKSSRDPLVSHQTNINSSKSPVTKATTAPKSSKSSTSSKSGISSLKRTTLSSVSKTSNLDKSSSNSTGNLKKTNSKANLKKSDSNASLKKSNDSSRPSTPTGKKTPSSLGLARNSNSPSGLKRSDTSNSSKSTSQSSTTVETNKSSSVGKKPVTSKIASLWKRSESQDSGTPQEMKPTKPPRQQRSHSTGGGQRSRLIPPRINNNNNNNNNKKSAAATPISYGLSRTHTYDKLSSFSDNSNIVPGKSGGKSLAASKMINREESLKDLMPASKNKNEEKDSMMSKTNSGTWKTQKSRSEARSLPDADQTCRAQEILAGKVAVTPPGTWKNSTAWDNDEQSPPSVNNEEIWVKRKEDKMQNEDENRKLLKMSHIDPNDNSDPKNVGQQLKPTTMAPSPNQTAHSKETVIDSLPSPPPSETKVWKSEMISPRSELKRTICSDIRTSAQCSISAAIVPPFNYTPSAKSQNNQTLQKNNLNAADQSNKILPKSVSNGGKRSSIPSPSKHLTKTEMLIARRRQNYMTKMEDPTADGGGGEDETRRSCRVTTV